MDMTPSEYDGFHMLPVPEEAGVVQFHYFQIEENGLQKDETIGKSNIGEAYKVMLLRHDENGVHIDDVFEAVFADPLVYAKGLVGMNIFGTFVKKTKNGESWFEKFLNGTILNLLTMKAIEGISNDRANGSSSAVHNG